MKLMKRKFFMRRMMFSVILSRIFLISLITLLLCNSLVSAKTYHMTLLTIGEVGEESIGGTADAYLEVKHGSGRIFLDSFPLTKIDTQISTRYANEVACDYLNMDCSRYDFFYTIRAGSTIVGGPSASASLTVLTIAALKDLELRNDTVMTGTINSGGSIGPVGGVFKKALAAEKAGFKRVLVPLFFINTEEVVNMTFNLTNGSTNTTSSTINLPINNSDLPVNLPTILPVNKNEENKTVNESKSAKNDEIVNQSKVNERKGLSFEELEKSNLSIEIIKVGNIEDALRYFTDQPVSHSNGIIVVPDDYKSTMKMIAEQLCERSLLMQKKLESRIEITGIDEMKEEERNRTAFLLDNINRSFSMEDYYSAASYCFNLGVMLRKASFRQIEKVNPAHLQIIARALSTAINDFDNRIEEANLTTLSELESYIIVKERLVQARDSLDRVLINMSSDELAYALERYYSAVYWSDFFNVKGKPIKLDEKHLKQACFKKLSEAEERINYAALYLPSAIKDSDDNLRQAYAFAAQQNYKMCLFKASFAKAESNLLLSTISVSTGQVEELADEKLKAAKRLVAREINRGFFPIMGYSYYEYARSLRQNGEPVTSLIFSEYALELSNIEIYFPKKEFKLPNINYELLAYGAGLFLFGAAFGLALSRKGISKKADSSGVKKGKPR